MLRTLTLLLSFACAFALHAQTAQLQVIHNSPTPGTDSGPTVDVYANGALLIDDFEYRTATGYVDVPADAMITVAVALGNSTSADDAIFTTMIGPLTSGEDYVAYANGAVGDTDQPFAIEASAMAEQTSIAPGLIDLLVFHGALDAPAVDVSAGTLVLVDDLEFGNFTDPNEVPAFEYVLTVTNADGSVTVGDFTADINGLGGQGINVFASGVLGGSPAFGLFATTPAGAVVELPMVPMAMANVQVIHNSPTPGTDSGPTVDVYAGDALLLDDFEYLTATPYVQVPAGVDIELSVAPATSTSVDDAIYTTTVGPLTADEDYVVYAAGVVGDDDEPFELIASGQARQTAAAAGSVDLLFHHGAIDAFPIDILSGIALADDLAFGEFQTFEEAPAGIFVMQVFNANDDSFVQNYVLNISNDAGLGVNIFATGVAGGTPPFGLYAALPSGEVLRYNVPSNVQFVHASPTPGSPSGPDVDVYFQGQLAFDDISYLQASQVFSFDTESVDTFEIAVAPADSDSVDDAIYTDQIFAASGGNFVAYFTGIVGDADNPFQMVVDENVSFDPVDSESIALGVFHGAVGGPNVDVVADGAGAIVSDLAYTESELITVPANDYILNVNVAGTDNTVARVLADLATIGASGSSFPFFAAGIPGDDANPVNLYIVAGNGFVLPMTPLAQVQVIHNSPSPTVDVYADDALILDDFEFRTATPYVDLPAGDVVLSVAPSTSTSVDDAIFSTGTVSLETLTNYQVMAHGIVGDADRPFGLALLADSRQGSDDAANVDVIAFHGGVDAPTVDVVVDADDSILFDDLEYGTYAADYVTVPAASYVLNVTPADDNSNIVAAFVADLSTLGGGAATVFASGYLAPVDSTQAGFGLYATLPDGTTFPLEVTTGTTELADGVSAFGLYPTVSSDEITVEFGLTEAAATQLIVVNANGSVLRESRLGRLNGEQLQTLDVSTLAAGQHYLLLRTGDRITVRPFTVQR